MSKIPFKVSARAARLIGRENLNNAESAVIELVKNSYDADGNCSFLYLKNEYTRIPKTLSIKEYSYFQQWFQLKRFYSKRDEIYYLREESDYDDLEEYFLSFNTLYILDDGTGMSKNTIENEWMTIGTNNKEHNYKSEMGRIQTGAKGIGRFALDRLGNTCTMYTIKKDEPIGYRWSVEWNEFEKNNAIIDEVFADLSEISHYEYNEIIQKNILDKIDYSMYEEEQLENLGNKFFDHGTLFKITGLRDVWDSNRIKRLNNSLESLIPPKEEKVFDIYLFTSQGKKYGAVSSSVCNDFDYKIVTSINEDLVVDLTIFRDEIDLDRLDYDIFKEEGFGIFPFDKETFEKGFFNQKFPLEFLLPNCTQEELIDLKNFTFTMYFMKRGFTSKDTKVFGYKQFSPNARKEWLDRYGGIKIFRDHFRVRPYGDFTSTAFDWLRLSERVHDSPAAITGKGAWRVRPNQVSGTIAISRENNVFEDKSSREGLQETKLFEHFQDLITRIIYEFEKDRKKVMMAIKGLYDKKHDKEMVQQQGKEIADQTLRSQEERSKRNEKGDNKTDFSVSPEDATKKIEQLEMDKLLLAKSYKIIEETIEEKENELKLLRALAGTGIALTSLAHEIKTLSAPLVTKNQHLKLLLDKLPLDSSSKGDIFRFIDTMSEKDRVLKGWLDVALNIVSKDKRKRKQINVYDVINRIIKTWEPPLKEKNIQINVVKDDNITIEWRAHIIDIESIVNNLVINSIISLQSKKHIGERKINVYLNAVEKEHAFEIIFQDNGPGLSGEIKDKNDIFLPLFSTRSDSGTGLGLWIVKTIVEEYNGKVNVNGSEGFMLQFKFPLRKGEGIKIEI